MEFCCYRRVVRFGCKLVLTECTVVQSMAKKDDPVNVNLFIYNKSNEIQSYSFTFTASEYPVTVHKSGYTSGGYSSWTEIEIRSRSYLDMKYVCLPAVIDVSPPSTSEYYIRISTTGGMCVLKI